jgi:thiol-disulfide isomerase/thioredoxin/sugar lactone lactonase YvrE
LENNLCLQKNKNQSIIHHIQGTKHILIAVICLGYFYGNVNCMAANQQSPTFFPKRLAVKPFPVGDAWINTAKPIKLEQLRGKFVLLDFWTLGCINCMHVIPELKKIEAAWPNDLVVIGVHSAKFQEEKNTKIIAQAALRYGLEHPIINDSDFAVWKSFGIHAWPSLVLIDTEGYAVWGRSGEVTFEQLDNLLKPAVAYYRKMGLLDEKPLVFEPEGARAARRPLSFPGKVSADKPGNRLFIADSGHNRIVIARLDGTLVDTIGDGQRGQTDGDYAHARFNSPQGMALKDEMLYVADTENHLIRKIDLTKKQVVAIAGTGRQSRQEPPFSQAAKPLETPLNSPWALCIQKNSLFIAMAGSHQIWKMPLSEANIEVYAGNGVEDIVDGPLAPRKAYQSGFSSFAQPSGLASDGLWLYVADAEGSSIRAVPFDQSRKVRTVVGTAHLNDARLFTFGDADGPAYQAKLQHPLGIVFHEGKLYIADTYNNKIKTVDPIHGDVQTLAGSGAADYADSPPAFNNPSGLSAAGGKLFVADTNNHAIRLVDLKRANAVSTLEIPALKPPEYLK